MCTTFRTERQVGNDAFGSCGKFRYYGNNRNKSELLMKESIRECLLPFGPELCSSLQSKNKKIKTHTSIILFVVFYGCETWPVILREERRLKVFEKRMLRKMIGYERERVTGELRKPHNEKLCVLYSTPNFIRVTKSRKTI
jgi:hypothetical protein